MFIACCSTTLTTHVHSLLLTNPDHVFGGWPYVQDTNYVNALSRDNTEANSLRRSILGAIRYGKPLVIDQLDCDLWENLARLFDRVQLNLLPEIMDRYVGWALTEWVEVNGCGYAHT